MKKEDCILKAELRKELLIQINSWFSCSLDSKKRKESFSPESNLYDMHLQDQRRYESMAYSLYSFGKSFRLVDSVDCPQFSDDEKSD